MGGSELYKKINSFTFFTLQIYKSLLFLNLLTSNLVPGISLYYCHLKQYIYLKRMKIFGVSLDMLYFRSDKD